MFKLLFNKYKNYLIIIDQSFLSLFNFVFVILLIRLMGLEYFGIFALLWIGVILSLSVQQGLIISPLFTLEPFFKDEKLKHFYGSLILQNLLFVSIISILGFFVLKLAILFDFKYFEGINIFLFCTTIFFFTTQNFFKRLFFSQKKNILGILSNLLSHILLVLLIFYFYLKNQLDINSVLQSYSISFFLGSLLSLKNLKEINFNLKINIFFLKENWKISKWIFFSNIFYWFSTYFWTIVLGLIVSPSLVAVVRACTTLAYSVNVIYQALENIIPSSISANFKLDGLKKTHFYVKKLCLDYFVLSLIFFLIIVVFSEKIMPFIYGDSLLNYSFVLIFFCLLNLINCFQYPIIAGLRTFTHTKPLFHSYLASSIFTVVFSHTLISMFDLKGFMVGLFFNQIIIISFVIFGYYRFIKKKLK